MRHPSANETVMNSEARVTWTLEPEPGLSAPGRTRRITMPLRRDPI